MALIHLLLLLGTGLLGSQAILVGEQNPSNSISPTKTADQSSALPFLEKRTGAVGHHGGGGTTCVVKGSYCQVLPQMNFYKYYFKSFEKNIFCLPHSFYVSFVILHACHGIL